MVSLDFTPEVLSLEQDFLRVALFTNDAEITIVMQ